MSPPITFRLEQQFQTELRVEWFTGTNARRAVVVADRVGNRSEAASDRVLERSVVIVVEEIEHLSAKLKSETFRDISSFEY